MRREKKRVFFPLWLAMLLCMLCACGEQEVTQEPGGNYRIYYLNREETRLESKAYDSAQEDRDALLEELLEQLGNAPVGSGFRAPLQMDFHLMEAVMDGKQLQLDLSSEYLELSATTEVLVRAALVRTLVQVQGVEGVSITVDGQPFMDRTGTSVGIMTKDSFISNDGLEINAYEQAELRLYFANEKGDKLVEITQNVMYNTNLPMERLVVEELMRGPEAVEAYDVLSPDTKLISVSVTDGVCIVNLDSGFLEGVGNVTPEVGIYAIVNSLSELSTVHKVQFLVNGESAVQYRELIDLSQSFSRNLDLVE